MVGRNVLEHPSIENWDVLAPGSAELDLTDAKAVQDFAKTVRPHSIVHAAGRVGGIQANMAEPVAFLDTNVTIGRNVIMAAREAGVQNLLNLASTCMYPREGSNPLTEDQILTGALEPTNEGYALAKIMAMRLCAYIRSETPGLNYKTMIPCNLYGRFDSFDPLKSHLVPAIIRKTVEAIEAGVDEIEIWGDGTARREFMYAGDLADAIMFAIGDMDALPGELNIGLGHDHTINDYYSTVAEVLGFQGRFHHDLDRPVGMKQKLSDTTRQERWGWSPKTSLRDGLAAAHSYFQETRST